MISQTSQFFAILTNVGVAKQANADALGVPWKIAQMGVGDANNTDPVPSAAQTKLINEWRRAPLNQLKIDPANNAIIIAEQVIPAEIGGFWIREIGLYDADGDLVAIANCAPSFKPLLTQGSGRTQVVRLNMQVSNSSNVELKIDPSVVLATRDYVDLKVLEELNKLDFKFSVLVATTASIELTGVQTIDDVLTPVGSRVLVKNRPLPKENGIFVAANGAWPRALDADTSIEVTPGLFVHVEKGTLNGDSVWQLETDGPIVLGTTDLQFGMVAGRTGVSAGTYRSVTVDKNGRVVAGANPTTIAGYSITDAYTKAQVDAIIAQASALPVGAMVSFPTSVVPTGFLEVDGSVKSTAVYPDLSAALAGIYNLGNEGAGNFRLPESRGEFLRGWDHGRGVDAGRAIGSWMADEVKEHLHFTPAKYAGGTGASVGFAQLGFDTQSGPIAGALRTSGVEALDGSAMGGGETRPRSLAVMYCIKAWNAPINQGNIDISALVPLAAQATEIKQGTTKVATQVQVDAGVDDATMVSPLKLKANLSKWFKTIASVAPSRAINVTYTNTTGRPIFVNIALASTSTNQTCSLVVNGVQMYGSSYPASGFSITGSFIIPAGATYILPSGAYTLLTWSEIS